MPLTVGIIGCGRMGQLYAEVYNTLPETELVAIAEMNPERLRVVGERFGVDALFADARQMLDDATVAGSADPLQDATEQLLGQIFACELVLNRNVEYGRVELVRRAAAAP